MDMNISVANPRKKGKNTKPIVLWGIAFVLLGVWTGSLWWQKDTAEKEAQQLLTSIENIKKQLVEKQEGKSLRSISESVRILKKAEEARTPWSKIMQNVLQYETAGLTFETFSISPEKNISVSASAKNLNQIKQLIQRLQNEPSVQGAFVSSVSEGFDAFSFQLSFQFVE